MRRKERVKLLEERTLKLLELSKKQMNKYAQAREEIFKYSCEAINETADLDKWEKEIIKFEKELNVV